VQTVTIDGQPLPVPYCEKAIAGHEERVRKLEARKAVEGVKELRPRLSELAMIGATVLYLVWKFAVELSRL